MLHFTQVQQVWSPEQHQQEHLLEGYAPQVEARPRSRPTSTDYAPAQLRGSYLGLDTFERLPSVVLHQPVRSGSHQHLLQAGDPTDGLSPLLPPSRFDHHHHHQPQLQHLRQPAQQHHVTLQRPPAYFDDPWQAHELQEQQQQQQAYMGRRRRAGGHADGSLAPPPLRRRTSTSDRGYHWSGRHLPEYDGGGEPLIGAAALQRSATLGSEIGFGGGGGGAYLRGSHSSPSTYGSPYSDEPQDYGSHSASERRLEIVLVLYCLVLFASLLHDCRALDRALLCVGIDSAGSGGV
jgi:hypothetical protein